jgi:two-component system, NtrC family, sensor histidine kinase HydH
VTVPPAAAPFNLSRWFAAVAGLTIAALAGASVVLLGWLVTARMLAQEGALTQEFVNSLLMVETPLQAYIAEPSPKLEARMADSFQHLVRLPDMLRTNIYGRDQRVIWSSDPQLVGQRFGPNGELERALAGDVVANRDEHDGGPDGKAEHHALRERDQMFVEIYVPVRSADGQRVIGAIEFYKRPRALARTLAELKVYIALGAVVGAALLYGALFGLVRRADRTIRSQQRQLVDQATLAALGEMSGAVAHGLRNPLAAIRSSAEMIPGAGEARASEAAQDIITSADRLEAWVRELLAYTQPLDEGSATVALPPLVARCLADFAHDLAQRGIEAEAIVPPDLPAVRGNPMLLAQVLRSLVANAIEAQGRGGRIAVHGARGGERGSVTLEVRDAGPGLTPQQLARVGQPFYTTKPRGLGVGLALARRVVERGGGRLEIDSAPGRGTTVRLRLKMA